MNTDERRLLLLLAKNALSLATNDRDYRQLRSAIRRVEEADAASRGDEHANNRG